MSRQCWHTLSGLLFTLFLWLLCFYRVMLCVSAVFAVGWCLSVTFVCCIQTDEDVVKRLSPPGSPIILFFDPKRQYPIQRETLQRGQKIHGVGKIAIFDWNRHLSRKRYEIDPWLPWNVNSKWRINTCQFWWPWVTLTRVTIGSHLRSIDSNYLDDP